MSEFRIDGGSEPDICDVAGRDDLEALRDETGVSLPELVALDAKADPFLRGTAADWTKALWLRGVVEELEISLDLHQRGVHYALVSHGVVMPTGKVYGSDPSREGMHRDGEYLGDAINAARDLGVFPADAFPDRKHHTLANATELRSYYEPLVQTIFGPSGSVRFEADAFACAWELEAAPRPSRLALQPVTVEILTEKDGIAPQLLPLAREYGCRLTHTVGFSGRGLAHSIFERARADGRPVVVLMFHDADSAGESMPIATARHLEFLASRNPEAPRVFLDSVGITLEQVQRIEQETGRKIPLAPDRGRDEGRVELDALPFFAPGWIEGELRRRLEELTAAVDYTPLQEAEERIRQDLDGPLAQALERMEEIASRARQLLHAPELETLRAALAQLEGEMREAQEDAEAIVDEYDADVPEPNVGDAPLDAIDWLLDTEREYLDQLNAYRAREPIHRRRPPLTLTRRTCAVCGGDMTGKKAGARYCGEECRIAASAAARRARRGDA